MDLMYYPHEKVELKDFIDETKQAINKVVKKECNKLVITKDDKPLFWFIGYKTLKDMLNNFQPLEDSNEDITTTNAKPQGKESSKDVNAEMEKKIMANLTQAQQALLKIHEKFEFFAFMTVIDILKITKNVKFLKLKRSEMIFEQFTTGRDVYFIISGTVDISVSQEKMSGISQTVADRITVARLGKETIFGEIAAITGETRNARATVSSETASLLSFEIEDRISNFNLESLTLLYKNFVLILSKKVNEANRLLFEKTKK